MLSHATYKVIHLLGIFLLFAGLGGIWASVSATSEALRKTTRRLATAAHGAAMLLILIAGFGMMARLQISHSWPLWIWIKLVVWLLLAGYPVLLKRQERPSGLLFFLAPLLGAVAAYAALFHLGQTP
jgi:cytochrome bd-type quinol oxidase subunit 2